MEKVTSNNNDSIEALTNEVKSLCTELQSGNLLGKKWLRTSEAQDYLSISRTQLHVLKSNGTLPVYKIGGTNFYKREEIDQILAENKTEVEI